MTAVSGAGTGRGSGRLVLVAVAVIGALALVGVFTAEQRELQPFDPESTEPDGTRAFVELAERFGARVEVADSFPVDADVAIAFEDVVPAGRSEEVRRWVGSGRTFVMADAASELVPVADLFPRRGDGRIAQGDCAIEAFRDVETVNPGRRAPNVRFLPEPGHIACFTDEDGAFAVLVAEGTGRLAALADGSVFTNQNLGADDNALLAVALVAPRPGLRVAVLTDRSFPGETPGGRGADPIAAILTDRTRVVLLQLLVALVVLALAAGRRVGRPLTEPQPVQIAGSGLVDAVGHLLGERRDVTPAARLLRDELRRTVAGRVGVAPTAPSSVIADAVAARTGGSADHVRALLDGPGPFDEAELVALADQIDSVRQEVLHGHAP